jgi:2-keto-3-deoxy-galactonokinase
MADMFRPSGAVLVVGGGALTRRYAAGFEALGLTTDIVEAQRATIAGIAAVRRHSAEPD